MHQGSLRQRRNTLCFAASITDSRVNRRRLRRRFLGLRQSKFARVVGAASASVDRRHRIRTERARTQNSLGRLIVDILYRHDAFGRYSLLVPSAPVR